MLKLFLNPEILSHKDILKSLEELIRQVDLHYLTSRNKLGEFNNINFTVKSDEVVENGRRLLYEEWRKIQNQKI